MTRLVPTLIPSAPLLLAGALVLGVGCGNKKTPDAAADGGAPGGITATMPDGKDAMGFAKKLVDTTVNDWEPISGGGDARFVYKDLTFAPDGTWKANAVLEASFEKIGCNETGTWSIESVDSVNDATMVWKVDKTNCPMREAGEQRVQMQLPKPGSYTINFR